jgi:hypothetical protein
MNPQRTILYLNYITNELSSKSTDKAANYKLITDLFNIDRDYFTNKYDDEKDIIKYSDELFHKLSKDYSSKTESYKSIISEFGFDTAILNGLKVLFHTSKHSEKLKNKIVDEGIEHKSRKIEYEKNRDNEIVDNPDEDKEDEEDGSINFENNIRNLLSEVIFLLSMLSTNYGIDDIDKCIFDKNNDYKKFKYEIQQLLESIEKDEILSDIFVTTINDRVFQNIHNDHINLFDVIKMIIKSIKEKQELPKQLGGNNMINTINDLIYTTKNKIYNIEDPDRLLDYIHENLEPKSVEKKERGEVFTSPKIINEMLSMSESID